MIPIPDPIVEGAVTAILTLLAVVAIFYLNCAINHDHTEQ